MKPFFSYFGSKYRLCEKGFYPAPKPGDVVIEAFAGSATYSVFHEPEEAILIDANPTIVGVWNYLINASEGQIQALPTFGNTGTHKFDEFDEVMDRQTQCARDLIGFWISKASPRPGKTASAWLRQYADSGSCMVWSEAVKKRIITQLPKIRGWESVLGGYMATDKYISKDTTLFIDPPYSGKCGRNYTHSDISYSDLERWVKCKQLQKCQIICCENEDLTHRWANFKNSNEARNMRGNKQELMCVYNQFNIQYCHHLQLRNVTRQRF